MENTTIWFIECACFVFERSNSIIYRSDFNTELRADFDGVGYSPTNSFFPFYVAKLAISNYLVWSIAAILLTTVVIKDNEGSILELGQRNLEREMRLIAHLNFGELFNFINRRNMVLRTTGGGNSRILSVLALKLFFVRTDVFASSTSK